MSKTKIYGFCDAGCRREVVSKEDFDRSASHILQYANDYGQYYLELGKEYKIFADKDTNNQFTCSFVFSYKKGGTGNTFTITHTNEDKYAESIVFRLLDATVSGSTLTLVYEMAGVRYTETISGSSLTLLTENYLYVSGATKVLVYNADATIVVESGGAGEEYEERLNSLEEQIAALTYKPIDITSFVSDPSTAEKGETRNVFLSWTINKEPTEQVLNGRTLGDSVRSSAYTGVTEDKEYTLQVTDEKGATDTAYATINFYNGVYYGVATEPSSYNSAFILGLTRSLQGSKVRTFTVTTGAGQYIYYCLPTSYGVPNFNVGGFDGGFTKVKTISFTNASGYTEDYDIYRSDNANLGNTTVKVS